MSEKVKAVAGDKFTITISATKQDGSVFPLSGASIDFVLVAKSDESTPVISKSIGSGVTIVDAGNGVFSVTFDTDDTAGLTGAHIFEAVITDASGNESTLRAHNFNPYEIVFDSRLGS
jgi:hypothetical protein